MVSGLTVAGVTVTYRLGAMVLPAVEDVDLAVTPGEVLALLGASGSGKSSLLRGIAGLEPLAAGRVGWDGADLAGVPTHRRGFGMMFQDAALFSHLDVGANVAYGLAGLPTAARRDRVAQLLGLVGLGGYERRRVTELSGGQAQRVALARSLAPRPRLLLLDEPLSALDRGLREHLVGVLGDVLRTTGTTAIHVTHDQDEAFAIADRIAVLVAGHLAGVGSPAELWEAPGSEDVAAFLGYGPFLTPAAAAALGRPIAPGHVLGVGPRGLVPDPDGVEVGILEQRLRRGYVRVLLALPGGPSVPMHVDEPVLGARVRVALNPAQVVEVEP